jgi:hypothetical protein
MDAARIDPHLATVTRLLREQRFDEVMEYLEKLPREVREGISLALTPEDPVSTSRKRI